MMRLMMMATTPTLWVRRRLRPRAPARCTEVAHWLQRYLDGEVDDHTRDLVSEHLETCRRCGLEASTYRELKDALARVGTLPRAPVERLRGFAERLVASGTNDA